MKHASSAPNQSSTDYNDGSGGDLLENCEKEELMSSSRSIPLSEEGKKKKKKQKK